jgi:DNA-binding IclR family transcriptional regulator
MPMATAHRLVGELVAWGALERDGARYQIGAHLSEVAALAPRELGLREVATPFLEDLYEATHEHVQLATLDGLHVVIVAEIPTPRAAYGGGTRRPADATGPALALLREILAGARRAGYAIGDHGSMGVVSVAAPVRDAAGQVVAALAMMVHPGDGRPAALAPAVVIAARGVSRSLRSENLLSSGRSAPKASIRNYVSNP